MVIAIYHHLTNHLTNNHLAKGSIKGIKGGTKIVIEIKSDTLDERIIRILMNHSRPVTLSELQSELGISESQFDRAVRRIYRRGIIGFDPLPDRTYVRLMRTDIIFTGRGITQKKPLKKKKGRTKGVKGIENAGADEHDIMYA